MDSLTVRGRAIRMAVTFVGAGLLLTGTVVGTDDHFPFGPFKMYSYTDRRDAPVVEALVVAVDVNEVRLVLGENETGVRRAEVEGQIGRFTADPARLQIIADSYRRRHPDAAPLATIRIVLRRHELADGRPTGATSDEPLVTWQVAR